MLFNGAYPCEDTIIQEHDMVGIRIGEFYCVSGYCSLTSTKIAITNTLIN